MGKTIQAIGVINCAPELFKKVLVICPATLKVNWQRELNKWLVVKRKVEIFDGKNFNPDAEIGIINFDNLTKHAFPEYDLVIIDEVHYCQNIETKRTKAAFAIKARRKLDMSGSPILNRSLNLWTILSHLDPERYNPKKEFQYKLRYCAGKKIPIFKKPGWRVDKKTREKYWYAGGPAMVWDFSGNSHSEELQRDLRARLMVRRLKADVLAELPAKRRQIIELPKNGAADAVDREMDALKQRVQLLEELQAKLELAKVSDDTDGYTKAAYALQEAVSVAFEAMAKVRHEVGLATVPYAREHIASIVEEGQKVIVFAHHLDVINALTENFPNHAMVTGQVSAQTYVENGKETSARQKQVDKFQNDPACMVFFGQDQAAAEGLTLTAASTVVFVEPGWVPGKLQQCEDRSHRIGQKNSVLCQYLVIQGSVAALMMETVVRKMNAIDRILDKMGDLEEPVAPVTTVTITKAEIATQAATLKANEVSAIHACLKILAGLDQDHALEKNMIGYNGADSYIGHSLAGATYLSQKQALLGRKLLKKYHKQLPPELYATATGATAERNNETAN